VPRELAVAPLTAVTVDLALQAAGFVPVPVAVTAEGDEGAWRRAAAARGAVAAVGREADFDVDRSARREDVGPPAAGGAEEADLAAWSARTVAAGPANATAPHPPLPIPSLADLFAAAETLQCTAAGAAPHCEVAVTTAALENPGERLLLAWSLLAGAALVLEPEPAARVATAVWARPTLFAGTAAEAAHLAREAESWQREWREGWTARLLRRLRKAPGKPSRPFGRLHTLVIDGPTAPDPSPWQRQGVTCHRLADLLP
jgi:hypothetical protein